MAPLSWVVETIAAIKSPRIWGSLCNAMNNMNTIMIIKTTICHSVSCGPGCTFLGHTKILSISSNPSLKAIKTHLKSSFQSMQLTVSNYHPTCCGQVNLAGPKAGQGPQAASLWQIVILI